MKNLALMTVINTI